MDQNQKFNDFLRDRLNEQQRFAVQGEDPAILVIAGAGSGKTRIITARIANLILNCGVHPESIVALTFTNKAAGEMRERIANFLGVMNRVPFIGTFHSYCLLLLRRNTSLLPFTEFSILDSDDQVKLIKKIMTKHNLNKYISVAQINYQLSMYKNSLLIKDERNLSLSPYIHEIYCEYELEKNAAHCLDFDDLMIYVLNLFNKNPEFKMTFQSKIRHILVDEYQDTSLVQHGLLRSMALNQDNEFVMDSLCAVGDEDQSIYSWRGATIANILSFQRDFAPVTTVKIEQNYRSVQPILNAANHVIKNNRLRNPKKLWSEKKARNRILVGHCQSGEQEAIAVAHFIQIFSKNKNKKLSDLAVLYRTHFQSRQIEELLIFHSIPYRIVGGLQFYERKEVKDLLAYLRLVANPFDRMSLLRSINCPNRGLGPKFEQELLESWIHNSLLDFKQILMMLRELQPPSKQNAIDDFLRIFSGIESSYKPSELIDTFLRRTNYLNYLCQNYEPREANTKIENVREFLVAARLFESRYSSEVMALSDLFEQRRTDRSILEDFLYEIALLQEKLQKDERQDQVQLMTLHAAKGLEFDTVIIVGLDEGLLPSTRSLNTNEELEEERRLFYVGITRAREYLMLLRAFDRNIFGQIVNHASSRFLSEIPSRFTHKIDMENIKKIQLNKIFAEWINFNGLDSDSIFTFSKKSSSKRKNTSKFDKKSDLKQTKASKIAWYKGTMIFHEKFGRGIIIKVEQTSNDFYLTVAFKNGQKKLLASYVSKV